MDTAASSREGSLPLGHCRNPLGQWGGAGWGEELLWELNAELEVQLYLESELEALWGWHQVELHGHKEGGRSSSPFHAAQPANG